MGWKLELVETGRGTASRRIAVARLDEIVAPASVEDIGLNHGTAQRILGDIQRAVVALQEDALRAKADLRRRLDPTVRLKDYRLRRIQSLHGTLTIRVPRLMRTGRVEPVPPLLAGSARSTAEYRLLLARLGAWMSFRAAAGLVEELFPQASGGCADTVRRRIFDEAERISARPLGKARTETPARSIDLGVDTTFVRSCATRGPRHHEVLIGIGVADNGRSHRIGGTIAALEMPADLIVDALGQLGRHDATAVTAFTDGDKMLRRYLLRANIEERPVLDWPHLARRVQVAKTTAKGLRVLTEREYRARPAIGRLLDSLHWRLWNGQTDRARDALAQIERRLHAFDAGRARSGRTAAPARRLRTAIGNFADYINGQSSYLVDYARRQRAAQPVGTSTSEGLANALVNRRMNKLQQMRWSTAGAHAVVTVRANFMNQASYKMATTNWKAA